MGILHGRQRGRLFWARGRGERSQLEPRKWVFEWAVPSWEAAAGRAGGLGAACNRQRLAWAAVLEKWEQVPEVRGLKPAVAEVVGCWVVCVRPGCPESPA